MDELIDKQVMVHPDLTHDPIKQQGNIGRITNIVYDNDDVFVRLGDAFGVYSKDALLLLRPYYEILENLREGIANMERSDIVEMLNIYLLQESGKADAISDAMYTAVFNDALRDKVLISLQEWVDRGLSDYRDRQNHDISR